jgi:hypothetical protein
VTSLEKIAGSFKEQFGGRGSGCLIFLLFIAVAVLSVALVRILFSPAAKARRASRARFRQLAAASQLNREESRLLARIAENYQLEPASLIFVKRSIFEAAMQSLSVDSARADAVRQKIYSV